MIKKSTLIILGIILCSISVLPISAISEFEPRTEPYFWGAKDSVIAHDLIVGEKYGALIGSNQAQSEQQWINFTSESSRVKIWFRQSSAEFTNETIEIQQLYIDLYKINTNFDSNPLYVDRVTLNIIYKDEQVDYGSISNDIIWIIITALMIVAFGGFIYAITKSKKYSR